jgi:DNA-binding NarL/FixJ family response regulator
METPFHEPHPDLRILLAGSTGSASLAITGWLGEHGWRAVAGPATTIAGTLALAATFQSDVVLLDFHGLPVSIGRAVSLFKERVPALLVFVLTHETSDAVRRGCLAVGADAVFHKTDGLNRLAAALELLRPPAAPGAPLRRTSLVSASVLYPRNRTCGGDIFVPSTQNAEP